jgi:hypothetical protein
MLTANDVKVALAGLSPLLLSVSSCLSSGCSTQDKTTAVLSVLEEGKARGHLVLTTSGAVSVGVQQDFYLGAKGTTLSFDGDIDFREADFDKDGD